MKRTIVPALIVFVLCISVSACAPAVPPSPTAAPATSTSLPTETAAPTATPEPPPTDTPEPTATPISLPDVMHSTFSGVSVAHRDGFEYVISNVLPTGWQCEDRYAGSISEDSQFKVQPNTGGFGTVCYFSGNDMTSGEGVYFAFKFTGIQEAFTLGFDALKGNGERIPNGEAGFHSVAMQMENNVVSAHIIREGWQNSNSFNGNLRLKEDTWYEAALGLDDNYNFVIKIWQQGSPEQQITYLRKWEDFPRSYYFISWVSSKRTLVLDDFTVFNFEAITQP